MEETLLQDRRELPPIVFHVVPESLFAALTNNVGAYDGRFQPTWGKNAPYIHTTTDLAVLKNRVSGNWQNMPLNDSLLLLRIDTNMLDISAKITYADYNGIRYYHIWDKLPAGSFQTSVVSRQPDGTFNF